MSGTRRLSQNQFIGNRVDLPLSMVEGSQYIAVDTKQFYIYDNIENPILIASSDVTDPANSRLFLSLVNIAAADTDAPTETEVETWNDSLPTPYSDVVCHYTGTNTSTDNTLLAFHIDKDGQVTSLGGGGALKDIIAERIYLDPNSTGRPQIGKTITTYSTDVASSGNKAGTWNQIDATPEASSSSFVSAAVNMAKLSGAATGGTIKGSENYAIFDGSNGITGGIFGNTNFASYRGTDPSGNNSSIDAQALYAKADTRAGSSGDINYLIGGNIFAQVAGSGDVEFVQGLHIATKLISGSVSGGVYGILLDSDYTGTTVNGDFAYLRIQNDTLPAIAGTARAIDCDSVLPSYFRGHIGIGTTLNEGILDVREVNVDNDTTIGLNIDISKENTDGAGFASNIYGAKAYAKANSTETVVNIGGLWNKAEHTGSGQIYYLTGGTNRAYHNGSGNTSTVTGVFSEGKVLGTGAGICEYLIGINSVAFLDNPNATVEWLQGQHCTVKLNAGEVIGNINPLILDIDHTGGTITGDLTYLRIQNDSLASAVGGTARAIHSLSVHPSEFAGSIESTEFIVTGGANDEILMGDGSLKQVGGLDLVTSKISGEPTGSDAISNIVSLTQAEYDAGTINATTLYIITDS